MPQKSLMLVSAFSLCIKNLLPTIVRGKATCITVGVMLNFDATQQNAERKELAEAQLKSAFLYFSEQKNLTKREVHK